MSAEDSEDETGVRSYKDYAAPLIGVTVLIVVILGFSAYWWKIAKVADCSTTHLTMNLTQPQGTAGTTYMDAVLTNNGKSSCLIDGYPTVFLTDSNGDVLGLGAASDSRYLPSSITLAKGDSVHSVLAFPDASNFSPGACSQASQFIRLYPPGQNLFIAEAFTQYSCPGFSTGAIQSGV